ncbi:MAG: NADH-quinone oxidoreductase subunit H [Coriobacteriia bacterium]|nr:NADH-quinone oxidoreductase subunit H [Coriobacteriia bacterium]
MASVIGFLGFVIFAPVAGALLAGIDRRITARMQGRVGPPILQPYYDVRKLIEKDDRSVNAVQGVYVAMYLMFAIIAGAIFFSGGNFLLCIFVLTLSSLFFIIAGYSTRSPYAEAGAAREMLQVMAYEPMVLLVAIGFYLASGSFDVSAIATTGSPMIFSLPLVFLGFVYVLTIKLRKSPFDLSTSHHAHQELVKGITTEMSGRTLAMVEVTHWYENIFFLGWVALFFVTGSGASIALAIVVAAVIYFLEILIDNNFARVKWSAMFESAWLVALVLGFVNLIVFYI